MHVTKHVYLDEVYKLYLKHFAKFFLLVEINATIIFMVLLWFHLFGTAPLMGFGIFFLKSHFSRKILFLRQKCVEH